MALLILGEAEPMPDRVSFTVPEGVPAQDLFVKGLEGDVARVSQGRDVVMSSRIGGDEGKIPPSPFADGGMRAIASR